MNDFRPKFPRTPLGARHVYVVARLDPEAARNDLKQAFVLTRGYWTEQEAEEQAAHLNRQAADQGTEYFVLPARVAASAENPR